MAKVFASRAAARVCLALGALVIASSMGGCAKDSKSSLAALRAENAELREAQAHLDAALSECDLRYDALTQERDELRAQLDGATRPVERTGDDFGFAPGSGVTVSQRGGEIVVEIAGDVLFQSGKVDLRNDAKQRLDQIASVIQSRYPGNMIRIAGHTDNDPIKKSGWKTNERLSSERALAVEEYLGSRGVSKDRMYAAAFGAAQPKGTKQDSRRVEIVILASGAS